MAYPYPGGGGGAYPPPNNGAYPPPAGGDNGAFPPGFGTPGFAGAAPGMVPPQPAAQNYGAPPAGYGAPPPAAGYGAPPPAAGYGAPPPAAGYGAPPPAAGYGAPPPAAGYGAPPPAAGYGAPPPGTQPPNPAAGYAGYAQQAPPPAQGYGAPPPAQGYGGYQAQAPPPVQGGYGQQPPPQQQQAPPPAQAGYGQQPPPAAAPAPVAAAPAPVAAAAPAPAPVAAAAPAPVAAAAPAPAAAAAPARPPPPAAQPAGQNGEVLFGTIKPTPGFDAEADATVIRKAMKGLGTDEKAIISILTNRTAEERVKIKLMFNTMYGKYLIKELKSELSGNFEDVMLALLKSPLEYDAWCLRHGMKGVGTDEGCLIEILCSRTNAEIQAIKDMYKKEFNRDLEKDVTSETSGHFRRLLVSMLQCNRDESTTTNRDKARSEAQALYNAGEGKLGTDESKFNHILSLRSYAQLQLIFEEYAIISGYDIVRSIEREFSGDIKRGLIAVCECSRDRVEYFCDRLYKSMKGAGTKDSTLIRIIVSRSEKDLGNIKQAFLKKYKKQLATMVKSDTSGDYKRALIAIIGDPE